MRPSNFNLKKIGKAPGTLTYTGNKTRDKTILELITYNDESYKKERQDNIESISFMKEDINWLNIYGLNDTNQIDEIGERFEINNLLLEDILSIGQRPKIDYNSNYVFIVLKMLSFNKEEFKIEEEQVSFVLKDNFLLTFQEREGDIFDKVRNRIESVDSDIKKYGADYLLYSLIDNIVDNNYLLLKELQTMIDKVEISIIEENYDDKLKDIYKLRKELMVVKTSVWPIRDILFELINRVSLITSDVKEYFKDVNDHVAQIMDYIMIYRETINGLFDTNMSATSNRMNEIMTTLTLYSTIFIPLTFITGVYGMNFVHMPELDERWSYPLFWVISIIVCGGMVTFFKRKKWL
ncbi:magnesium/cobalt transporter CorA [Clostridium sp. D2Q-11]|uniref:Magnesium transport protein CorA n=1 Tax=Anaeromonas frigoriresistens TaxID=2683708 RepID=A0A942UVB1_9FIRM|nr:magnesium/cobalt transporter CorA [Anaeromonas frigoriresistens]MBS4537469.1 magnesium/cobalt transporter CorA [Anaeromonas frigoriresistens]